MLEKKSLTKYPRQREGHLYKFRSFGVQETINRDKEG